jgi:leader peptidase (prepilin peptidase) / N-methyltransferase
LTTSVLVASSAAGGLVVGVALTMWTRRFLASRRPGLSVADWIAPLLTAILFGILAWRFGTHFDLLPYSCLAAIGVALAVIDVIEQRLPSPLVYSGLAVVGALLATSAALHSTVPSLLRAVAGMAVLVVFYLVLALLSGGGLGAGDVKLGGLLGLALGWLSWSALVTATFLGWFAAALVWLLLRVARRSPRGSVLPMGPFLLFGALLTISLMPI